MFVFAGLQACSQMLERRNRDIHVIAEQRASHSNALQNVIPDMVFWYSHNTAGSDHPVRYCLPDRNYTAIMVAAKAHLDDKSTPLLVLGRGMYNVYVMNEEPTGQVREPPCAQLAFGVPIPYPHVLLTLTDTVLPTI